MPQTQTCNPTDDSPAIGTIQYHGIREPRALRIPINLAGLSRFGQGGEALRRRLLAEDPDAFISVRSANGAKRRIQMVGMALAATLLVASGAGLHAWLTGHPNAPAASQPGTGSTVVVQLPAPVRPALHPAPAAVKTGPAAAPAATKPAHLSVAQPALGAVTHAAPAPVGRPVPTAVAPVTVPASAAPARYVIRSGDTLLGIARRHHVTLRALLAANDLRPTATLHIGHALTIPASAEAPAAAAQPVAANAPATTRPATVTPKTASRPATAAPQAPAPASYRVRRGDSLFGIAERLGTTVVALRRANPSIRTSYDLRVGHLIAVPGRATTTPAQTAASRPAVLTNVPPAATRPAKVAPAASAPAPRTYRVHHGDTLGAIAHRFHLSVAAVRLNNQDVHTSQDLHSGMVLTMPPGEGFYHRVRPGETVGRLLVRYGVSAASFSHANPQVESHLLRAGSRVYIPRIPTELAVEKPEHAAAPKAHHTAEAAAPGRHDRRHRHALAHRGILGDLGRMVQEHLLWPVAGHISSGFGYRGSHFHTGVDIIAPHGMDIGAARAGVVVEAGWDGSYGNSIVIDHGDGLSTRYAHCSKILVHEGDHVDEGQTVGLVGSTGNATCNHVHFEVRMNGRPVDPDRFGI